MLTQPAPQLAVPTFFLRVQGCYRLLPEPRDHAHVKTHNEDIAHAIHPKDARHQNHVHERWYREKE